MSRIQSSSDPASFAHSAAKFALMAPGLLALLGSGVFLIPKPVAPMLAPLTGLIAVILVCAGFVCSLIALCNIPRFGRAGLLGRGIAGLILNGLLLAVVVQGFLSGHGVRARASQRNVRAAVDDMRQSLRQSFHPRHGLTNVDSTKVRAVRTSLDNAAAHTQGDEGRVLKAAAAYAEKMETARRSLKGAHAVMEMGKVLQFTNAPDAQDFARRRRLVQNYQAASERVRELVTNAPAFHRAELERLGMAPANIERAMADMQNQFAVQQDLLCAVRDTDARITDAMLEILGLLQRHPDHWKIKSRFPFFTNSVTGSAFKQLLGQMEAAGRDQVEAQRKLVNLE